MCATETEQQLRSDWTICNFINGLYCLSFQSIELKLKAAKIAESMWFFIIVISHHFFVCHHINTIEFIISDSIINANYNFIIHFIYLYVNGGARAKFSLWFSMAIIFSLHSDMHINCTHVLLFYRCDRIVRWWWCWCCFFQSAQAAVIILDLSSVSKFK